MGRPKIAKNIDWDKVIEEGRRIFAALDNPKTKIKAEKGVFRRGRKSKDPGLETEKHYDASTDTIIVRKVRSLPIYNKIRPKGSRPAIPEFRICPRCGGQFIVIIGEYYGGDITDGRTINGYKFPKGGDALMFGYQCTGRVNQKYCPDCRRVEKETREKKLAQKKSVTRLCRCGADISFKNVGAKTCSAKCRKALSREDRKKKRGAFPQE